MGAALMHRHKNYTDTFKKLPAPVSEPSPVIVPVDAPVIEKPHAVKTKSAAKPKPEPETSEE